MDRIPTVYINAGPTEALDVTIKSSSLDLRSVATVAVTFQARNMTGSATTWTTTILSASATEILARHAFATSDVTRAGEYVCVPYLGVTGVATPYRCEPFLFHVANLK